MSGLHVIIILQAVINLILWVYVYKKNIHIELLELLISELIEGLGEILNEEEEEK